MVISLSFENALIVLHSIDPNACAYRRLGRYYSSETICEADQRNWRDRNQFLTIFKSILPKWQNAQIQIYSFPFIVATAVAVFCRSTRCLAEREIMKPFERLIHIAYIQMYYTQISISLTISFAVSPVLARSQYSTHTHRTADYTLGSSGKGLSINSPSQTNTQGDNTASNPWIYIIGVGNERSLRVCVFAVAAGGWSSSTGDVWNGCPKMDHLLADAAPNNICVMARQCLLAALFHCFSPGCLLPYLAHSTDSTSECSYKLVWRELEVVRVFSCRQ